MNLMCDIKGTYTSLGTNSDNTEIYLGTYSKEDRGKLYVLSSYIQEYKSYSRGHSESSESD